MLETILAISGKPGLYKLVSRGNNNLIVETIDAQKKRFPAFAADKVISLADIAMYTDEKEVPLREVLCQVEVVSMYRGPVPSDVALPGGLWSEWHQKLARRAASPGLCFLFWETGTLRCKLYRV